MSPDGPVPERSARRIRLSGHVQGVGFRPFVYRAAARYGIDGHVLNCVGEVEIHAEGSAPRLEAFQKALIDDAPPLARPVLEASEPARPSGRQGFTIQPSEADADPHISVPPDYFTCDDCVRELQDPDDRRHAYPFINCTQCGPRYTLIDALPYDRPNTSMAEFELCPTCLAEYEDPADRRFHAEPVACEICGPSLRFVGANETVTANGPALERSIAALNAGAILAVKGVGGYHLMCDSADPAAIANLRQRKPRPDKPLALMLPAGRSGTRWILPSAAEHELLESPMRPIVLIAPDEAADWENDCLALIAPGLDEIGVMMPYSPLHHLLLEAFGRPLVATSANISGEPVFTNAADVDRRLGAIADASLHHNRPILRPADDAVFRTLAGRPRPIRLGRGAAPLELRLPRPVGRPILAVGGHMKNTVALAWEDRLVISPHIGDMGTARSLEVFETVVEDLQRLYAVRAETVLCDAHPRYVTSRWARNCGLTGHAVGHHRAHASLAVRTGAPDTDSIVFTWDGVGFGDDGTLWGGETFVGRPGHWRRAASMRPFRPPGGDRAGREPWRSAAALCWEADCEWNDLPAAADLARVAWERDLNCPTTSAVGRLFDGAAALIGLVSIGSFEGQGPMWLEAAANRACATVSASEFDRLVGNRLELPLDETSDGLLLTDWAPLLPDLANAGLDPHERALSFQINMVGALVDQAQALRARHDINTVGFGGGCFQNRFLTTLAEELLRDAGFEVLIDPAVPLNDGGLCAGQILEFVAGAAA
jgi:hydrogenase maturation protein HypF